ncbi:uncharacterized protein [Periplaneta americana]|uniref:uncharacterized protein isoform X8 n=1 Tax=Periplaneta americana TaxID=6978 RepID=UPI0037E796E3
MESHELEVVMDIMIKKEPEDDPLAIQSSDNTDTDEKKPLSEISVWCEASMRCNQHLCVMAWNQRGPGYVSRKSPSTQFVCKSTSVKSVKCQEWVLEDHDEEVADQSYPRHVRWATVFGELAGQGSSDTRRSSKKAFTTLATCDRALSC